MKSFSLDSPESTEHVHRHRRAGPSSSGPSSHSQCKRPASGTQPAPLCSVCLPRARSLSVGTTVGRRRGTQTPRVMHSLTGPATTHPDSHPAHTRSHPTHHRAPPHPTVINLHHTALAANRMCVCVSRSSPELRYFNPLLASAFPDGHLSGQRLSTSVFFLYSPINYLRSAQCISQSCSI